MLLRSSTVFSLICSQKTYIWLFIEACELLHSRIVTFYSSMIGLVVGGWFASAFISNLVSRACSFLEDRYEYASNIKQKLKSLQKELRKIEAVLHEADRRNIENSALKDWLLDLKEAAYAAEDVLDMFEYKSLEDTIKGKDPVRSTSQRFLKGARTIKRVFFSNHDYNDLCKVVDRFKKQSEDMVPLIQLITSQPTVSMKVDEIMRSRETTSTPIVSQLFGRESEQTYLIRLLFQPGGTEVAASSKHVHVLSIVGIGGVGKTTLAQEVYNDQTVKDHFDLRAWVCVSDNFDVKRLTREIIESASIPMPADFHNLQNLDSIADILKRGLTGKRVLIVLDDVWNEVAKKSEDLLSILNSGKEGSRVIVTTRIQKIADMMGSEETMMLEGLPDNEYWELFVQCAFGGENPENHPELESFGWNIVKKLGGLPLAAKVLGAVLKSNLKEQHWKEISESNLWEMDEHEDGIKSVLRLSYEYLPAHLKQCFVYCSLFPHDYRFSKKKLVRFWMAQGFIQPKQGNTLEMMGKTYFNGLVSRSFFQIAGYKEYKIHDLLHDLAIYLSDGESYKAGDNLSENKLVEIPKKIRHAYISSTNLSLVCSDKYAKEQLRSLVVVGRCDISLDILKELKCLRLLILEHLIQKLSSESFRQMFHLRYLEIVGKRCQDYVLPESLFKLYHLQVLSVGLRVFSLSEGDYYCLLPRGTNRLINLHHLIAYTGKIAGIGTSTCLQELRFLVNQKESGYEMRQLRDMSQLRKLCIEGLDSVESKEQASEAKLCDKGDLKELTLKWSGESHIHPDEVLEGLQPHQNLKHLEIWRYSGKKCPSWWNGNWISYLNRIELTYCSCWEILPSMGQFPHLKSLELMMMDAVTRIGPEFYGSSNNNTTTKASFRSLERLYINGMCELKEWCNRVEGLERLFPRLSSLSVFRCPKLRGPLCLPSPLRQLHVQITEESTALLPPTGTYLCVIVCPSISRLKEWIPWQNLASIEHLEFWDEEMTTFPDDQLEEWVQHLTSLRSLHFEWCTKLQSLPSMHLHKLSLRHCRGIQSLSEEGLPSSLKELVIDVCSDKFEDRCRKDGIDWPKISHIPTIIINSQEVQRLTEDSGDLINEGPDEEVNSMVASISHAS